MSFGRKLGVAAIPFAALVLGFCGVAQAQDCVPGAPGLGDAYYPTYGNGGYDVGHYDLDVAYDPATDQLDGDASVRATATESLCSFDLDLVGLDVRRVEVDGKRARWSRSGQELVITPKRPLQKGRRFEVEVRYGGVPVEFVLPGFGIRTGFMKTPDGATVAGQPEVAASWFPVNDHPLDKASYSFAVTVPDGYEVVANGSCVVVTIAGTERPGSGRPANQWRRTWPPSTSATGMSTNGRRGAGYRSTTRSIRRSRVGCER